MVRQKITLTVIFILLSFLCLPSSLLAQAQEYQEYKDYTVMKGDTLWDISKKELQDPFCWPKIWKENPGIANPDRIHPQQQIRIPLSLSQKEISLPEIQETKWGERVPEKETVGEIEPPKKEYLVGRDLLAASGYIADSVHSVGSIVDSPTGRTILGMGDYAYVKTDSPAKVGEKFYIIRPVEKVIHPKSGKMVGYLIEVLGIAEIVGQDGNEIKAKITASYSDIFTGSLLDSYYEAEPPYLVETHRKPHIDGYIVAAKEMRTLNGMLDIVYIDKGIREGLELGDVFATLLQGKHRIVNSVIQVINIREATSTAIVRKSNNTVTKGDEVVAVK